MGRGVEEGEGWQGRGNGKHRVGHQRRSAVFTRSEAMIIYGLEGVFHLPDDRGLYVCIFDRNERIGVLRVRD